MDKDDMPDDPVSGKMVMTTAYNLNLQNGQILRFASQSTLNTFLQDPNTGLKGVAAVRASDIHSEKTQKSVLCPVCGMETSVNHGSEVIMLHGDQAVHTCSMAHAREIYLNILSYQVSEESDDNVKEQNYCTGPGTTMLNGFSLSRSSTPCILLWFPGWVLNSRLRYIFGGIIVALLAVFNEYLLQLRRKLRKESSLNYLMSIDAIYGTEGARLTRLTAPNMPLVHSRGPSWFYSMSTEMQHSVHSLLHGITLFVAYMLMLVSMTYDFTLLLWVLGGYVFGHFVFGERCEAPFSRSGIEANFP
ncbi:hypothetical protein, variant 1 [Plasmopara halstedii]|uniref:Copper transport protein n=1 Tax=Plasmopara halstedii TaxID=4781 RepID=A0A0P1AK02_PLAHL|nr:hypothetical protein, variant 1 [Plasmopara halstedii]CEG40856.1 hypothetical protein, variant 1 [Plasmopara halstedii]|eukprot:XP_024577225.1 hypothetical protein, variant 1 [Plasmopara halstedii]